jgi:hypothetical protein
MLLTMESGGKGLEMFRFAQHDTHVVVLYSTRFVVLQMTAKELAQAPRQSLRFCDMSFLFITLHASFFHKYARIL